MLRIRTSDFQIEDKNDFSLEEMIRYTENMEVNKFESTPESFDYTLFDVEDNVDIIDANYVVNNGYKNICEHVKELLKHVQVDSDEMKSVKRFYLKELDSVSKKYASKKKIENKKQKKLKQSTIYNAKKSKKHSNSENILSQLKSKKGIGALLLILLVFGVCYFFIVTSPSKYEKETPKKEEIFKDALLGNSDKAVKSFEGLPSEEVKEEDKTIYAKLLVQKGDYDKAIGVKEENFVENELYEKSDFKALEDFESNHSTYNGQFDLAIHHNKYDEAIKLVDQIDKTHDRKRDLATAYIETNKLEEAKVIASNLDDQDVNQRIEDKEKALKEEQQKLEKNLEEKKAEFEKFKKDKKKGSVAKLK